MYKQLEDTIDAQMERNHIPGLAIALIQGDEVVFAQGYGVTSIHDGEPVTPETRFSIQSVTKPITVSAMMQLRDAGHFHLDDPANKHLAPAAIANEFEAESPVTIRQLMTHSGGLPVTIGLAIPQKLSLPEYLGTFARTTCRPGTEIIYANLGFDAMGVLIESFSGQRVDDYLHEHIFWPLGMTATDLADPSEGDPHATGHYTSSVDQSVHALPLPDWPTIPPTPAGGCWSNVLDLSRFLIAHLNGGDPILDSTTAAEMQNLQFRQGAGYNGQGIGFRVTRANGRKLICHGGDGSGFTALIAAHPEEHVAVVLFQNSGGMQSSRAIIGNGALQALIGGSEGKSFAGAQPLPQGVYESTFWDILIEARPESLVASEGFLVLGEADATTLRPVALNTFEASGGMLHGFEVTLDRDRFFGGVYPFTFVRKGDLPLPKLVDEAAKFIGTWRGTALTPMGPLAVTIKLDSENVGTFDTPFQQGLAISNCVAASGRLEGESVMQVPGVGNIQVLLRLACSEGRLSGKAYARSDFGEIAMLTELEPV